MTVIVDSLKHFDAHACLQYCFPEPQLRTLPELSKSVLETMQGMNHSDFDYKERLVLILMRSDGIYEHVGIWNRR